MFIKIGLVKALSFAFHSSAVLTFQLAYCLILALPLVNTTILNK